MTSMSFWCMFLSLVDLLGLVLFWMFVCLFFFLLKYLLFWHMSGVFATGWFALVFLNMVWLDSSGLALLVEILPD